MNTRWIKAAFGASAVYDGILAFGFLFLGPMIFDALGLERPNHWGYLHFPALLLVVFAFLYGQVASDPVRYRVLIPYGIGLKASYCAVVLYHWLTTSVPAIWIPLAWIDLAFLIVFLQAWRRVKRASVS